MTERIDALADVFDNLDATPELRARLWAELALPNLRLLAEFCTNITFDREDEGEGGEDRILIKQKQPPV